MSSAEEEAVITSQPIENNEQAERPLNPQNMPSNTQETTIRTEPVKMLDGRKKRLDRQVEEKIPEIHIVGEIKYAKNVSLDFTEGIMCR
jgi:hypothetical protein